MCVTSARAKLAVVRTLARDTIGGQWEPWLASVTFGGANLQTAYLGGLRANVDPLRAEPRSQAADGAICRLTLGRFLCL
jgi:hypothetical protein